MSDTGSNDPYDPNRPRQPEQPEQRQPPQEPRWGSNPPPPPEAPQPEPGGWSGGQFGSPAARHPAAVRRTGSGGQYGQHYGQPYGQPGGTPPPNYLVWAILCTIFCCLPLGIASIVFAAQVNGKYAGGDIARGAGGVAQGEARSPSGRPQSVPSSLVIYILVVIVAVGTGSS